METRVLVIGLGVLGLAACGGPNENPDQGLTPCSPEIAEVLDDDVTGETITLGRCTVVTERVAINDAGRIEVEPGSTVYFEQGAGFWLLNDGVLDAVGTAEAPILFTGTEQQPGFWRNVYLESAGSTDNALEYVTVEYAGSGDHPAVHVEDDSRLTVRSSVIRHSGGPGFHFEQGLGVVPGIVFEANTVTGNALAGRAGPLAAGAIDGSNALNGNDTDRVEIDGPGHTSDVTEAITYRDLGIPYLFTESFKIFGGGAWTVEPGVEILVAANQRIAVGHDGVLSLGGTAEAPITIRGQEAATGYWQELYVEQSSSPSNLIAHTILADSGGGGSTEAAALYLQSGRDANLRLTLDTVTIRDSGNHGIYADQGYQGELTVTGCETVTFEGIEGNEIAGDPICS